MEKKWNINEYYVFVALVNSCQFGGGIVRGID